MDPIAEVKALLARALEILAAVEAAAPPEYVDQESCAPMSKRVYLEAARANPPRFPTTKAGRRVLCLRSDFDAFLKPKLRPPVLHVVREEEAVTAALDAAAARFGRRAR